jgi:hypothetical protein
MSTLPGVTTDYCRHGLPPENCSACCSKQPYFLWSAQHPSVAGHCGKCGAPYTADLLAGTGPPKFIPTCACWNVPR